MPYTEQAVRQNTKNRQMAAKGPCELLPAGLRYPSYLTRVPYRNLQSVTPNRHTLRYCPYQPNGLVLRHPSPTSSDPHLLVQSYKLQTTNYKLQTPDNPQQSTARPCAMPTPPPSAKPPNAMHDAPQAETRRQDHPPNTTRARRRTCQPVWSGLVRMGIQSHNDRA